jgi:hypothetical protein
MNRAGFLSAQRTPGIGLSLALFVSLVNFTTPAPADPAAQANADLPRFLGMWRATVKADGNNLPIVSTCDGRSFAMFVEGQSAPFAAGKFEIANGRWKTLPVGGASDEGPYRFIDADTVSMTGKNGQEVIWKRVKPPSGSHTPSGTQRPSISPLAQLDTQPTRPGLLQDFAALRKQSNAVAANWNAGAQLFRVDLWGAYSRSRFQPAGARFFYFVPKSDGGGLEVRFENNSSHSHPYPLDLNSSPEALPETVLSPDDALRRLWDLAPTVHDNQVYLQLLRPGIEKPISGAGDNDATSYPLQSFLQRFPFPLRDNEAQAPKDRTVWRMLAVRDYNVVADRAYGTFLYIDAASGAPLSKRQPAVGVQIFMRDRLSPPSPIQAFVFPEGEIPLDSAAEQVGTFDALAVAQKAESIDLGLRALVRDGRTDDEIRAAIDKMCAWVTRIDQVRQEDAARGLTVLEEAARQNPQDVGRQVALFKRYVDGIEREKKRALASPRVIKIEGLNKLSEFWLPREFELTSEALGTRNQTHVVLDTRSGEWIYKMADPPHTGVYSRSLRPALETLKAIRTLGRNDYDLERQITRLNWLVGGNGPALGQGDSLNPIDALQLVVYAEFNRVRGSENLLNAERLRLPKTWSTQSRREIGNGRVEITTTTFTRQPTAAEFAAADRLDAVAKGQDAPRVAAVEDLALKLESLDPRIYYLWSRVEAAFYDLQLADRVAVRGLTIDPGCAELHAVRVIAWQRNANVNKAEVYCAEKFASRYTASDLQGGGKLAALDPVAAYFLCLQRLRIDLANVGAHAILCSVIRQFDGLKINGEEIIPDALEQSQRDLAVGALMLARLLDRPGEWQLGVPKGMPVTRENLLKNQINLLTLRGQDLAALNRKDEARVCFQKILAIDPQNQAARKGLESTAGD